MNKYDENGDCEDCGRKKGDHRLWCHTEMVRRISERAWEEGRQAGMRVRKSAPEDNPYTDN